MGLGAVLASLPAGYELVRGRRGVLAVARAARARLEAAGFGPDGGEHLSASDLHGRAPLGEIRADGERWVVRRFHHGGWLRALGERAYLEPARPFEELKLAQALGALGVGTPPVVAARACRSRPFGWSLALVSVRLEDTRDGAGVLEALRAGELGFAARRACAERLGELVGRLHAARFLHADLQPRNVLFAAGLARTWILDLDRGRFVARLGERARRANLRRLYRAVRRREARGGRFLTRGDYLRFLRAYGRGGAPRAWRGDWRAIVRGDRAWSPLHRLGWLLERLLGAGPAGRDGGARSG